MNCGGHIHCWAQLRSPVRGFLESTEDGMSLPQVHVGVPEFWHHEDGDHHHPSSFCLVLVFVSAGVFHWIDDAILRGSLLLPTVWKEFDSKA